jgi:hypothetical protein
MNRWTLSACLLAALALSACGGGNTAANTTAPDNTAKTNEAPKDNSSDEPKVDPDAWKKVSIPTPEGWDKMHKDGQSELRNSKYDLLLNPSSDYKYMAAFCDKPQPDATSGSDEEWKEWRETVSGVFVYNAAKTKEDPVETLKKHGAKFIKGFDAGAVRTAGDIAVYIQPDAKDKWLACTSNERGTYILCALVRNTEAGELMKPYPAKIKPE